MNILERMSTAIQEMARSYILGGTQKSGYLDGVYLSLASDQAKKPGEYLSTSNAVYTCVTGRADLLVNLVPRLYRYKGDDKELVTKGSLIDLLTKVNPFWTFNRLLNMTELDLGIWGWAFWFLERGASGKGKPVAIWRGKPSQVQIIRHASDYIAGFRYKVGSEELVFSTSEVIWFRYNNPEDEFKPLSPLQASRLSADYATDALLSNRLLFRQGGQMGGYLMPKDRNIDLMAAQELERQINKKIQGIENTHKWSVFRLPMEVKPMGVNPKDAEFLGGLKYSLEEVCRAYKWPLDLAGGQRTYENYSSAMKAAYTHAVIPEAKWIASEITEQLIPLFASEADVFEFDASGIDVLQEEKTAEWERERGQLIQGAITINEWRQAKGLDPVEWGDKPLRLQLTKGEIGVDQQDDSGEDVEPDEQAASKAEAIQPAGVKQRAKRGIAYDSEDHRRLWRAHLRQVAPYEREFSQAVSRLIEDQKKSVLDRLANRGLGRGIEDNPFDLPQWIKRFREKIRPLIKQIIDYFGAEEMADISDEVDEKYGPKKPAPSYQSDDELVIQAMEQQAQTFANQVNQTTWEALRKSLAEGVEKGEGIDQLKQRVEAVMGDRIASTPEVIARTEVARAVNAGKLAAYKQSGIAMKKSWLAALDERTRQTHLDAHERYQASPIGLDADFIVGDGAGPCPCAIGLPEEDIQCRCVVQRVLD